MNVTGIIAEYNPFHNGHAYHMEAARQKTNADFLIVLMSGDFVQRGTPALIGKFARAKMALFNGADLVLELPCAFATSSAEYFSEGAVSIFHELGVVTDLCFGSETADLSLLSSAADLLLHETDEFKAQLSDALSKGFTYPQARSKALLSCMPSSSQQKELEALLKTPNNILSIEYLKSLKRRNSFITPHAISRIHSGYHEQSLSDTGICSATAIRSALRENQQNLSLLRSQMPASSHEILETEYQMRGILTEDDLSTIVQYRLLEQKNYSMYLDMNQELSNRLSSVLLPSMSFSELSKTLKSRQYTLTRINRALLHILLGITNEEMLQYKANQFRSYARILGLKKRAFPLLKQMKLHSNIPIIQQLTKANLSQFELPPSLLQLDLDAHRLYETVLLQKYHLPHSYYEKELGRQPFLLS